MGLNIPLQNRPELLVSWTLTDCCKKKRKSVTVHGNMDPEQLQREITAAIKFKRLDTDETNFLDESLQAVLSKKSGQRAFRDFLKSEFCEENLDFWLACQDFQAFDHPEQQTQMAVKMYDEFIKDDSPKQVNLDFYTKDKIRENLRQPSSSCFVVAQRRIYSLMENDSFPRFTQTEQYKVFIDATFKQRGLRKHRMAVRIKLPKEGFGGNMLQSSLLLLHKD